MCKCKIDPKTPYCGAPGCEWPLDEALAAGDKINAKAYINEDGTPTIEISLGEMNMVNVILKHKLGHEPSVQEVYDFIKTGK